MSKRNFIFLFFLFIDPLFANYDLAICAIFKNEAPFLKEWIEFHKLQGVQHFFLYNNNSEDDYLSFLEPYLNNEVTLVQWPSIDDGNHLHLLEVQTGAYMDCIKGQKNKIQWIACIDLDEFLFCPTGEPLTKFLDRYTSYGGVCVNWIKFGTSNVEEIPAGKLMIETLVCCNPPNHINNHSIKSIVQPHYVKTKVGAHSFGYVKGKYAVNAEGLFVPHNPAKTISLDKIRINHYWARTEKYFREKKIARIQRHRDFFTTEMLINEKNEANQYQDDAILQFVEDLRKAMGM